MKRPFMVWIGFISICCSKVAKEGKSCPRLLVLQRVAQNAKSCSKVAEHNLFMPTRGTGWGPISRPPYLAFTDPAPFFLGFLPLALFRSRNAKHCCVIIPPPPPLIYPLHTFLWTTINSIIKNFATLLSKTLGTTLGGRSDGCPQIMEYNSSLRLLKHIFCLTTLLFAFFSLLIIRLYQQCNLGFLK